MSDLRPDQEISFPGDDGAPSQPPASNPAKDSAQMVRWLQAVERVEDVTPMWHYYARVLSPVICRGWCNTAATDGKSIFFNPDYVETLTDDEVTALVIHEVFHVAAGHLWRGDQLVSDDNRFVEVVKAKNWNRATDYAIHQCIKPMEAEGVLKIGEGWLYDPAFDGMDAETIFELLRRQDKQQGEEGALDAHVFIGTVGPNGEVPQGARDRGDGTWVVVVGADGQVVDQETIGASGQGVPEGATAEGAAEMRKQAIQITNLHVCQQRGNSPGGFLRRPGQLEQEDWRIDLDQFVHRHAKHDFTWSRPNRRWLVNTGLFIPGRYSQELRGIVAIDTSGSIDEALYTKFASRLESLRQHYTDLAVVLLHCDAAVQKVQEVGPCEAIDWEVAGGGGTDFRPVFDRVEAEGWDPEFLLYMSDGYGTYPSVEPGYPVLWCLNTTYDPPFGEVIRLK